MSAGSRAPSRTGPPPSQALTERLLRVDRLSAKSANLEGKPGAIDARLSTRALAHTVASRLAPRCLCADLTALFPCRQARDRRGGRAAVAGAPRHHGCTSAVPRVCLGCISAVSRLYLGRRTSSSRRRRSETSCSGRATSSTPRFKRRSARLSRSTRRRDAGGAGGAREERVPTPRARPNPPQALRHLVDKNAAYKAALAPAGPRTPLAEQRALLEEQHRAALAR